MAASRQGYRVSPDIAEAIVRGDSVPGAAGDRQSVEAAMAVQGYSAAFDRVLEPHQPTRLVHGYP
jgi:hypothetical protein